MNQNIERYLNRATRGLWGRKRQDIREELSAHIQERIKGYRLAGLSETEATEKSLQELGQPKEVNREMLNLYVIPKLLGSGVMLAALALLSYGVLSNTSAQTLSVEQRSPTNFCLGLTQDYLPKSCVSPQAWVQIRELRDALTPQGVEITETNSTLTLEFPEAQAVKLMLQPSVASGQAAPDDQLRRDYLGVWNVINAIAGQAAVPVVLSGWDAPTLDIGEVQVQLGARDQAINAEALYFPYLSRIASRQLIDDRNAAAYIFGTDNVFGSVGNLSAEVTGSPGIYGLVARLDLDAVRWAESMPLSSSTIDTNASIYYFSLAEVSADGQVTFAYNGEPLSFAETLSEDALNTAVLVRLTGELQMDDYGYEVVSPENIRLEFP